MSRFGFRRLLAVFACVTLLAVLFPLSAFAAYENTHKNTDNQRLDIVEVAKTQIGYHEGSNNDNKYGASFQVNHAGWCAFFVSWCARQANIPTAILPSQGAANGFNSCGEVHTRGDGYIPQMGDLALFYGGAPSRATHVGIVERYESTTNRVWVIDGNWSDKVSHHWEPLTGGNTDMCGFIVPRYSSGFKEITVLDITEPPALTLGEGFALSGLICSPRHITSLKGEIVDSSGNPAVYHNYSGEEITLTHTLIPDCTAVSLTEFNGKLPFSKIEHSGKYTLVFTVTDTATAKTFSYPFTVESEIYGEGIAVKSFDLQDPWSDFPMQGAVLSPEPIDSVTFTVINKSTGQPELICTDRPDDVFYDLSTAPLRLDWLGAGTYTLRVEAKVPAKSLETSVDFKVTGTHEGIQTGDLTFDGVIDIEDALLLQLYEKHQTVLTSEQKKYIGEGSDALAGYVFGSSENFR